VSEKLVPNLLVEDVAWSTQRIPTAVNRAAAAPNGSNKIEIGVLQLLVTANVVPSSPILFTLMIEAIRSPRTPVLSRATRLHIPEDGILLSSC
jgi:hypothetical protein